MLRNLITTRSEATELKGSKIPDSVAIIERLEVVLDRLEKALAAREAENLRLRQIEAAASTALAELDALLGDSAPSAAAGAQRMFGAGS